MLTCAGIAPPAGLGGFLNIALNIPPFSYRGKRGLIESVSLGMVQAGQMDTDKHSPLCSCLEDCLCWLRVHSVWIYLPGKDYHWIFTQVLFHIGIVRHCVNVVTSTGRVFSAGLGDFLNIPLNTPPFSYRGMRGSIEFV